MESGVLLGHVVSRQGLEVDSDKVRAILALVAPKNVQEVRGFLRCVGYYRRVHWKLRQGSRSLDGTVEEEDGIYLDDRRQDAFEDLKRALTTAPVLSPPDWEQEFHVTLDASGWCLRAILWQNQEDRKEGPIYYASRQMSPAERNYTTMEREVVTIWRTRLQAAIHTGVGSEGQCL